MAGKERAPRATDGTHYGEKVVFESTNERGQLVQAFVRRGRSGVEYRIRHRKGWLELGRSAIEDLADLLDEFLDEFESKRGETSEQQPV